MVFKQVKDNQLNFRAPAFLETITFSMLAITSIWQVLIVLIITPQQEQGLVSESKVTPTKYWIIIWGRRFCENWNEEIMIRVSLEGLINLVQLTIMLQEYMQCKMFSHLWNSLVCFFKLHFQLLEQYTGVYMLIFPLVNEEFSKHKHFC